MSEREVSESIRFMETDRKHRSLEEVLDELFGEDEDGKRREYAEDKR